MNSEIESPARPRQTQLSSGVPRSPGNAEKEPETHREEQGATSRTPPARNFLLFAACGLAIALSLPLSESFAGVGTITTVAGSGKEALGKMDQGDPQPETDMSKLSYEEKIAIMADR